MVVFCLSSTQEVITGTRNYGDLNNFFRGMGRGDAIFQLVLCPQADVNKGDWVGCKIWVRVSKALLLGSLTREKLGLL